MGINYHTASRLVTFNTSEMNLKQIYIQSAIGVGVIAFNLAFPDFAEKTRYLLLGLVILLIGMPHGALDHIIDGKINDWNPYTFNKWFYGWYLSAVAVYSVLWVFFPMFSFLAFLLITVYHFGQADAERFPFRGWRYHAVHYSRGFTVVGLIVFGDLTYASAVMEAVTSVPVEEVISRYADPDLLRWIIAAAYPVTYGVVSMSSALQSNRILAYSTDALVVPALFLFADPVWAFSIYFGLWHSYNHTQVMLGFLADRGEKHNFVWFFKQSFIFSMLSYLGILYVYNILNAFGNEELMVSLLFVVIAVLTLPHMLVVEKLYGLWKRPSAK